MPRPSALDAVRLTAGRPRLLINRRALLFNLRQIRSFVGEGVRVCAVVKAEAYGHGAAGVVDVLTNFYTPQMPAPAVDALAVASLAEGEVLPELEVPIFVLRPVECVYLGDNRAELEDALRRGFILSLISTAAVDDVARIADRLKVRASVQVVLDTGMTREGCDHASFRKVIAAVLARPNLRLAAIGTHFTDGELEHEPYNDEQLRMFHETVDPLLPYLPPNLIKHAGNSGGTFFCEDEALDMVRPGLALYGIDPTCRPCTERPLRPVAKWTAPILSIREVKPGTTAGYNRTWRATKATRIGLVPVGYADGYPRALSNRAVVRVAAPPALDIAPQRDAFCPVVGRVSMDYLTVDLASAPWAQPGDEVILLDDDPTSPCSAYVLSQQCETVPYELLCNIGARVVRVGVNPSDAEMAAGS
jgi:alanine racemase